MVSIIDALTLFVATPPEKTMALTDHLCPSFRKDMGCSVVGSAGTAAGLEAVVKAGADRAVNHRRWDQLLGAALPIFWRNSERN